MAATKHEVSNDLATLRKIANLPVPARSARWEIVYTPEDADFVPGPTVAITLMAELLPLHEVAEPDVDERENFLVVAEAPRPWLLPAFHALMTENANQIFVLGRATGCHPYRSRINHSPPVNGMACFKPGHVLLYLPVMSD